MEVEKKCKSCGQKTGVIEYCDNCDKEIIGLPCYYGFRRIFCTDECRKDFGQRRNNLGRVPKSGAIESKYQIALRSQDQWFGWGVTTPSSLSERNQNEIEHYTPHGLP